MADSLQTLADQLKAIKDTAESKQEYRESLLLDPKGFLAKQGVDIQNIAGVAAEYHLKYGVCILIEEKVAAPSSPAPNPRDKDSYDFFDCHNF